MIHLSNVREKPYEVFDPIERDMTVTKTLHHMLIMGGHLVNSSAGRIVIKSHCFNTIDTDTYTGPEEEIAVLRNAMMISLPGFFLGDRFLFSLGITKEEIEAVSEKRPWGGGFGKVWDFYGDLFAAAILAKETGTPFLDIVNTI